MDQDSILLLSQLENLPELSRLRNRLKKRAWTPETNTMLDMCFQQIHKSHVMWEMMETSIIDTLIQMSIEEFQAKTTDDYNVIPEIFREAIDKQCINRVSVIIPFENRVFTIFIGLTRLHNSDHLYSIIYYTFLWLHFVNEYVSNTCSNEVSIFLFFLRNRKLLPDNSVILDRQHINTAFTSSCQKKTNVYVFREEEWFRALIHESFHNLGLDLLPIDPELIEEQELEIRKRFPVRMDKLHLSETYCELWAEMLNVMFYVYTNHYPTYGKKLPLVTWKDKWMSWMVYERLFSLWQCVKVLRHNNIHYEYLLEHAYLYQEKTPTFSYYILKCILSTHLDDFLSFCADQYFITSSTPYRTSGIKFHPTRENLEKFCNLLLDDKCYFSIEMLHGTRFMARWLPKKPRTTLYRTLRMSLIQHEL
jgi:hypothetical protein